MVKAPRETVPALSTVPELVNFVATAAALVLE
jgi:hypothetical protein